MYDRKSKCQKFFEGFKTMLYRYCGQAKSWLTSELFDEWVRELDKKFLNNNRKIVLQIDKCPSFKTFKLFFFFFFSRTQLLTFSLWNKTLYVLQGRVPKQGCPRNNQSNQWRFVPFKYYYLRSMQIHVLAKMTFLKAHIVTGFVRLVFLMTNRLLPTSSLAHLFAIRGKRKRGPGTLQTRDQNFPK